MYFDSDSQEQVFKVISQSVEESEVCSVLNALKSISYPGLICSPVRSSVPMGL